MTFMLYSNCYNENVKLCPGLVSSVSPINLNFVFWLICYFLFSIKLIQNSSTAECSTFCCKVTSAFQHSVRISSWTVSDNDVGPRFFSSTKWNMPPHTCALESFRNIHLAVYLIQIVAMSHEEAWCVCTELCASAPLQTSTVTHNYP